MELLAILLGEFLLAPLVTAFTIVVNGAISAFSLLLEMIFGLSIASVKNKTPETKPKKIAGNSNSPAYQKNIFTIARWSARISGIICLLVLLIVTLANILFFNSTVKFAAKQVSKKTGATFDFDSADGNIFTGKIHFKNIRAEKIDSEKSDFRLSAKEALLDIEIFSLLSKPIVVEKLLIDGVKGEIIKKPSHEVDSKSGKQISKDKKLRTRTNYEVKALQLTNIDLTLKKTDKPELKLLLSKIGSKPFRSQYAVFDTFFRSNIQGSLNGHNINISTEETPGGRKSKWRLNDFPVEVLNHYIEKAPFSWFKTGTIDIHVDDEWKNSDHAEIEMDWNLHLKGVFVEPPQNASALSRYLGSNIVKYINAKGGDVDFKFAMVMNENQFETSSSLDAAGMWDTLLTSMGENVSSLSGKNKETLKEGFKKFLDLKRKRKR
jgi:hypothetical protein